ncbi:hypothetical protein COV16_03115 [Candidatus Woesearchaeota archaeon CG10_big_fil_rev_8_21_14_0_10_34_8]|nr:MAG: hypothetical protein COV16_03115 [Candidatus Woesearchaeota archaeon CG10_big_fil_rev_8_21_14_0_10_34_8]
MRFIHVPKQKKVFGINTSDQEINDLIKGWVIISIAFTVLLYGFSSTLGVFIFFIVSLITVGTGFIFHEMGHKLVAQHYKCWAEFRADNMMLMIALVSSFFGFIIAAPGAVVIYGPHITKKHNGIISSAGPLTNFAASIIFFGLLFFPNAFVHTIALYGFLINSWLGLFNLIPIMNFDGRKILKWSKPVYSGMVIIGVFLGIIAWLILKGILFSF